MSRSSAKCSCWCRSVLLTWPPRLHETVVELLSLVTDPLPIQIWQTKNLQIDLRNITGTLTTSLHLARSGQASGTLSEPLIRSQDSIARSCPLMTRLQPTRRETTTAKGKFTKPRFRLVRDSLLPVPTILFPRVPSAGKPGPESRGSRG